MKTNPFRPPSSFQRRLESSGLNKPFPHSGNDSKEIPARAGRPGRAMTKCQRKRCFNYDYAKKYPYPRIRVS